jgi:hypothetical protein
VPRSDAVFRLSARLPVGILLGALLGSAFAGNFKFRLQLNKGTNIREALTLPT